MSVQPEELIDPREQAFWESDPSILRPPSTAQSDDDPRMVAIGLGIAAAVVGIGMVVRNQIRKKSPQTPEEARGLLMKAWETTHRHTWKKLVAPALLSAYEMGAGKLEIAPKQLELLASLYADELGDYFHQTSVDALVDGFSAQLNKGYNDKIAWGRSVAGYGLDSKQTRSYIIGLVDQPKEAYEPTLVPAASQNAVDKAIMIRADRLGINESYKATQMGRNMVWVYLENEGELTGARKQWHTAEDERVCPVCAPLDGVTVGLHDQFESSGGEKFYVPGVHPNCRCWLSLVRDKAINVAKAMSGDPYDRDSHGRFSSTESRKSHPIGIERAPIGTRRSAIGESRTPIGMSAAPLGWARPPIGQERPAIGAKPALGPVKELTLADLLLPPEKPKVKQAPIGVTPEIKTKTKVKAKAKAKTPVKAKVKAENPALVKAPIKTGTPALTDTSYEIHDSVLLVPGSNIITQDNADFKAWMRRDAEGKYFHLKGHGVWGNVSPVETGVDAEDAWLATFDHEMAMHLPPANPTPRVANAFGIPHDRWEMAQQAEEHQNMLRGIGSTVGANKNPLVVFLFEKGWRGISDHVSDFNEPGIGEPQGWYQISQVIVRDPKKMSSYPRAVGDLIEEGGSTGGFHNIANAQPLISQVVYIRVKPMAGKPKDENLILKRKWRD